MNAQRSIILILIIIFITSCTDTYEKAKDCTSAVEITPLSLKSFHLIQNDFDITSNNLFTLTDSIPISAQITKGKVNLIIEKISNISTAYDDTFYQFVAQVECLYNSGQLSSIKRYHVHHDKMDLVKVVKYNYNDISLTSEGSINYSSGGSGNPFYSQDLYLYDYKGDDGIVIRDYSDISFTKDIPVLGEDNLFRKIIKGFDQLHRVKRKDVIEYTSRWQIDSTKEVLKYQYTESCNHLNSVTEYNRFGKKELVADFTYKPDRIIISTSNIFPNYENSKIVLKLDTSCKVNEITEVESLLHHPISNEYTKIRLNQHGDIASFEKFKMAGFKIQNFDYVEDPFDDKYYKKYKVDFEENKSFKYKYDNVGNWTEKKSSDGELIKRKIIYSSYK